MTRDQAFVLAQERVRNKNLFKHVLAVEAVMAELARHLAQPELSWRLAGLLHDLDYEETAAAPEQHTLITEKLLAGYGIDDEIVHAIKCHNNLAPRESLMDKALYASDPSTGLVVASALMHPDKKLAPVTVDFILRRFKEKGFAKGANREQIMTCQDLDLDLPEFIGHVLRAMQEIHDELGL
jgi:uncharacterized protein